MATTRPEGVLDTLGMFEATAALPEQIERARSGVESVADVPQRHEIEHVLVLGMGGSGIAGDLLAAVAGPFMPVPVVVCKGYEPPSFVGHSTLCLALSFSGDTEETLEAAAMAAGCGAALVTFSAGGELKRLSEAWEFPHVDVDAGIPMPRAAIGAMAVPPLLVLERAGLFPGASEWVGHAVAQLRVRRDELVAPTNPARSLAGRIGRTLPLVYGGGDLGAVAATRWKNQFAENAKVPAFASVVPELMHNEISGWGQHGDVTRQLFTLVLLRHEHEHPQVMRRFELVREWTAEVVAGVEEVRADGEGELAQLLDLVLIGDFVSLWLAYDAGVDPGPVPVLDAIKQSLATR